MTRDSVFHGKMYFLTYWSVTISNWRNFNVFNNKIDYVDLFSKTTNMHVMIVYIINPTSISSTFLMEICMLLTIYGVAFMQHLKHTPRYIGHSKQAWYIIATLICNSFSCGKKNLPRLKQNKHLCMHKARTTCGHAYVERSVYIFEPPQPSNSYHVNWMLISTRVT